MDDAIQQGVSEQPTPVVNDGVCIQDLVVQDIEARKAVGIQRYGTFLQPHNGRDALQDAYEEALDLAIYLRQALEERNRPQAPLAWCATCEWQGPMEQLIRARRWRGDYTLRCPKCRSVCGSST